MRSKQLQELLETYQDDLMIQESSYDTILASLKKKVHVIERPFTENNKFFIQSVYFNLNHSYLNQGHIREDQYKVHFFTVERDERSRPYYQQMFTIAEDEFIYVLIEENLLFVESNCSQLHLELTIEKGICRSDYQSGSIALEVLLSSHHLLDELKQDLAK